MNENGKSSRISHQPDWLIAGLLKAAAFPEQEPTQPMFNTGVTFAQLKDQVRSLLQRSGLNLTKTELSSGTYWLTQRIANQVGDQDTRESLIQKMNDFVAQYIVDKSVQRASGVHERSPIYDRSWYDQHFTPPPDREAAAESKDEPENGAEIVDMVYVGLDGDGMGGQVEESLLTDDPEIAASISRAIHEAHKAIREIARKAGGRLIFDGGDNMLLYMPNDPEVLKKIAEVHKQITKHTITIGVGHRPIEAHFALVVGKNTGKNKTVAYDETVQSQYEMIREEQEALLPVLEKLKYRASALDDMGQMDIADRLRRALLSFGADSSDESVNDFFWRLVQHFDLGDLRAIDLFFAAADENDLRSALRQTYAKRSSWAIRLGESKELTEVEARAVFHDLVRATEAGKALNDKFQDLIKAVDDQALRDLDEAGDIVQKRFTRVCEEFADMIDGGKPLRRSHYVDEVRKITAEITSMAIPFDQALTTALLAVSNAEKGLNRSIEISQVIELSTKWIERVNSAAMALDLVCVVSGARPMKLASDPVHFPGQTNVPGGHGQKSPRRRHDWLTIEEYNRDQVDWSKTDNQAGLQLPGEFAERSVGGDAGGSPIYVP